MSPEKLFQGRSRAGLVEQPWLITVLVPGHTCTTMAQLQRGAVTPVPGCIIGAGSRVGLLTAAHSKGQMVVSTPSQGRLGAGAWLMCACAWAGKWKLLWNDGGRVCISPPASGTAYIHQTQMACYSSALADAISALYIDSGRVNIGTSQVLYEGYGKGSGHFSFDVLSCGWSLLCCKNFLCEICLAVSLAPKSWKYAIFWLGVVISFYTKP